MRKKRGKQYDRLYLATDGNVVRLLSSRAEQSEARKGIAEIGMTPLRSSQLELLDIAARGAVVETLLSALDKKWREEDELAEGEE